MGGLSGIWAAAAALAGIVFFFFLLADWATVWSGGEQLARRLAGLRGDPAERHREGLLKGLDRFARWVGDGADGRPNHFSASSFLVCLGAAVFYPLFFLALFWVAGGPGSIRTLEIFPDETPAPARLVVLGAMILPGAAAVFSRFF